MEESKSLTPKSLSPELIERLERVTGKPVHPFIRRGIVCTHRDLERILDLKEQGKPFYLYTGRGPSSNVLHLGHFAPFLFCKYLQDVFNVPLVIQITDDEKYLNNAKLSFAEIDTMAQENIRDIIAFGFDLEKTFIFLNSRYLGNMYRNVVTIQRKFSTTKVKAAFGWTMDDKQRNIGQIAFPATQAAPCLASSFAGILPFALDKSAPPCLIPCAIDQDPYFLLTRDIIESIGDAKQQYTKPSLLYTSYIPALNNATLKMSSTPQTNIPLSKTNIFTSDTEEEIQSKIKSAISGGAAGSIVPDRDVALQMLKFFYVDGTHENLSYAKLYESYCDGKILSSQLKSICGKTIANMIAEFKRKRALVTDDVIENFTRIRMLSI